ncbi:hypothetical protein PAMP_014586 [Pampus punctatissimus]
MFLRQLSSVGSSFLPRRAGFRSSSFFPGPPPPPPPPPWWTVRGYPLRPPPLPHPHTAARHLLNINPGNATGSWRSFGTSTGLMMERPNREPPHKRRKSEEEKRSTEEREGHRGGASGGKAKDGGSKKEHRHPDTSRDGSFRPNHHFKNGSRYSGKHEAGRSVSRENSRDKDVERTKDRDGNRNTQRKDGASRDEAPHGGRSTQQQRGQTESQPAAAGTQTSRFMHKAKANPWLKEERDRSSAGGQEPVRQQQRPAKALQRHWDASPACSTCPQPPGDSAAFDFSVLSYNILSQELLQDNASLYRHCHPGVLRWDYRLPNLLAEIRHYNADILCLQEVQEDHYENQIKPALQELGYQCEYKKRTGKKPDGCAVVYKTSRLSLLSSNPVEFFRPGDALLDRDNVGLVVLLRPNDTAGQSDPSAFICVANTHLLYNPRRGDIKLAQLAILLAEIRRLSRLPDGSSSPVVLCGDFNSTPSSPLYNFLTTGSLEYQGLQIGVVSGQEKSPRGQRLLTAPIWPHSLGIDHRCRYKNKHAAESSSISPTAVEGAISNLTVEDLATKAAAAFHRARIEHSLKLQSSYQHFLPPDGRPEITTCHSHTAMTVDYILHTPDSIVSPSSPSGRGLQLLGRLSLVGQLELEDVNGLPNHQHSSDHLPLLAHFRYRR